jgi:hypothetical protein
MLTDVSEERPYFEGSRVSSADFGIRKAVRTSDLTLYVVL